MAVFADPNRVQVTIILRMSNMSLCQKLASLIGVFTISFEFCLPITLVNNNLLSFSKNN